jgi:4'-phosphopantetheinyl transferase
VNLKFQNWFLPPELPTLAADEVHVWRVNVDACTAVELLRPLLSPVERARADKFRFKIHRERFTVARACLRTILGKYLESDPTGIEFSYGEQGKPYLTTVTGEPSQIKFNLSHSHSWALYAFARGREIGVDLERISPELAGEEIARKFFSAAEVKLLEEVPGHLRREAFFNCWTRKEAFIKAKGMGLTLPLNQFDVTVAPFAPAVLLRTRWDESEALRWLLQPIDVGPDYVGVIAVEGHNQRLSCWEPSDEFLT